MVAIQNDIYADFADFIAGLSPEKLLTYYAPAKMQRRVETLVERKKQGTITEAEGLELEKYFLFEHIVRLAKAKALKMVSNKKTE